MARVMEQSGGEDAGGRSGDEDEPELADVLNVSVEYTFLKSKNVVII